MQHDIVIMRNKLPGEKYQNQFVNAVVNVEGDLEVGGSQEKAIVFFLLRAVKCSSAKVLRVFEGTFPGVAQEFHSPFTSSPSNHVLPPSLIPQSSHPQNNFAQFLLPIRNKSFVTHSHTAGTAPQGTAQHSAFRATFLSFSPPQRKTSQYQ